MKISKREYCENEYKCPYRGCTKKFKKEGMNDENYRRHMDSCSHGKKVVKGDITHFLKKEERIFLLLTVLSKVIPYLHVLILVRFRVSQKICVTKGLRVLQWWVRSKAACARGRNKHKN